MDNVFVNEPSNRIPVAGEYDVIICGAGPAGIAAALFAARAGAHTLLIETHGCLGGIWTAGLLSWIIHPPEGIGVMRDLIQRLDAHDGRSFRQPGDRNFAYDPEVMKWALERLCIETGAEVRLHTRVVRGVREGGGLAAVVTESKSGRQAWRARCFVDATGDGDLAAFSGCRFEIGPPDNGRCQPMSLMALLTGIRFEEIEPMVGGNLREPKQRLLAEFRRAGVEPTYGEPTLFKIHDDLFALMSNHEYGVSALDARAVTEATMHARDELHRSVKALRALGGPWSGVRIVATAEQIGVREARRPLGLYRVSVQDLTTGARHPDAVCRVAFGVDVHGTDPTTCRGIEKNVPRVQSYDIPLRALIAADVDNLLFTGRCISGDFFAHASYRVTGYSVALGEAAGVAAAAAARSQTPPRFLEATAVLQELTERRSV